MSSLRIVPATNLATTTSNPAAASRTQQSSYPTAPSAPGLPDTLRASLTSTQQSQSQSTASAHPLEARLTQWRSTQETLQHSLLRRTHGLAEPLRRSMELHLVRQSDGFRASALGMASGVHEDILSNRDCEIGWEDVYAGQDGFRTFEGKGGEASTGVDGGFHGEMEKAVHMGKW